MPVKGFPRSWEFRRDGHVLTPNRPFILEVCGGSCRVTATFRRFGLDAWGVDHKGGRLAPETLAILYLDLTVASDLEAFWRLLGHPLLCFVHFSPPCGTCSRARERAVPGSKDGGPPPVRSESYPLGFPDLQTRLPREFVRVQAANTIYEAIGKAASQLLARGIAWSIENPWNSLLWLVPAPLA